MIEAVKTISEQIWQAKKANDMAPVRSLIAEDARFVHMGITFDKEGELGVFDQKRFVYKDVAVSEEKLVNYGSAAIIYKKLILTAQVGGNEVQNPFVVSEVFSKTAEGWQLAAEMYTRIATDFEDYQLP